MSRTKKPKALGELLKKFDHDKNKYISREFQDYGYRLAVDLNDMAHKSLYIRMAKNTDRKILEAARRFVVDADHAKSKGRLFMWKVSELKKKQAK